MFRRLRENGPVVLVPLAWTFAVVAHEGLLAERTVLIAHLVMTTIMVAFAVLSWQDMTEGVLLAWKGVIVVGAVVTALGVVGLLTEREPLLSVTVVGWLLLPAAGLAYTGPRVDRLGWVYLAGGALSAVGAVGYVLALVSAFPAAQTPALVVAGVGQTAGIVAAVVAY